jgi:hypothetical protein
MPPGRRRGRARGLSLLGLLLLLLLASSACGRGGGGVDGRSFERSLVERERISSEQARCVSRYVFAAYADDEIRQIVDDGIASLPSPRWAEYGHAVVTCLFHDELAGESLSAPASPSPTSSVVAGP